MSLSRRFSLAIMLFIAVATVYSQEDTPTPAAIMDEISLIAQKPLWPGFDPSKYPVAFYDGSRTLIFNFPGMPDDFKQGENGEIIFDGRHSMMSANTSVTLDGVPTATVMLDSTQVRSISAIAGLTTHELFHVYTNQEHGSFGANEAQLFTYPFTNVEALALRKMETEAMRRAYSSEDISRKNGWTLRALLVRLERAQLIGGQYIAYERAQEKNEGLAQYIQDRAADYQPAKRIPDGGWAAEQVRNRCYVAGQFWAEALDMHLPEWKAIYNLGAYPDLDIMLLIAMTQKQIEPLAFTEEETLAFNEQASLAVDTYKSKLLEDKKNFDSLAGYRIEVVVDQGANLLSPSGFDPLNVLNLGDGLILHTRMLRLSSSQGMISMLNRRAISFGPNSHPLFNGVQNAIFAGFDQEPNIEESDGSVKISTEGLDISFSNAVVEHPSEKLIRILLKKPIQ